MIVYRGEFYDIALLFSICRFLMICLTMNESTCQQMECPVCFQKLTTTTQIHLECNHRLCSHCAQEWIIPHSTCPLCRQSSNYYNRSLRSSSHKRKIYNQFKLEFNSLYSRYNGCYYEYLRSVSRIIHIYILDQIHVWYHPQLSFFLRKHFPSMIQSSMVFLSQLSEQPFQMDICPYVHYLEIESIKNGFMQLKSIFHL